MFWGLIMEPHKRYTQVVEKPFHISQAAMDITTGDSEPCQVMVVVDGKNFLVCTLQKKQTIQVPLDLYFKAGDSVSFLTNGTSKCTVHLTGYLDPEFEDDVSDEEEEDEDEAPELVPAKNKRKLENNTDGSASKKAKPEKKAAKKPAADDSDDSDEEEDQLQKFLDGEDVDTDENDDSFKVNTSAEGDDSDEEDSEDDDDEEAEDEAEENESSAEGDSAADTSRESQPDMSKLSKSAKKRLLKKLKKQGEQPQVNGVDKAKKEKPAEQKKDQKKKEAKPEEAAAGDKKEKKSLSGGVFIEDLKVGSGAPAKPGKVVQVYYEGRLKSNNKKFDDCLKGPGFKFRLGSKEVISGWDVGVAGMRVGGKRRIVCPPAMAYGAKGSPPVIPPNSTLVFEVELKNLK